MKTWFFRHQKLHLWLGIDLVVLLAFWLLQTVQPVADALAAGAKTVRLALASVCYRLPFSVMELLCALLALFVVVYLIWTIVAVIRSRCRWSRLYAGVLGALCVGLTIYLGFCYLWGVNYSQPSFQDQSGIREADVSVEDLQAVTELFAARLGETAHQVERDENGLFSVSREGILERSVRVYDNLEQRFPFLAFDDPGVKAVHFSRIMSLLDFTGIYCPFTGESSVNVDSPACMLPSTVAHELAHQRGYPSEQECNFLAVLACTTSEMEDYVYSGWLLGYVYLANALYRADYESWEQVTASLPETVRADLAYKNAYWDQFRDSGVTKASNLVYDSFLKSYGVAEGMQSYGMVVNLLVAYYKDAA